MLSNHTHITQATAASIFPNNSTTPYKSVKPDSLGLLVGLVMFYVIVAFIAITSNICILIAILRKLVPRNTVNIFLASLALSDLLMVSLSLFDCFAFINGGWIFGEWSCKIQGLFVEVCFTASTLTLVSISVERYLIICYPHIKRRSMRVIYMTVISLWTVGLVICSPLLHGYSVHLDIDHVKRTEELVCGNQNWSNTQELSFYVIYSFILYVMPMLIMSFAHCRISVSVTTRRPTAATTLMIQDENERREKGAYYAIHKENSAGSDVTVGSNDFKPKSSTPKTLLNSLADLRRNGISMDKDMNRSEHRLKAVRLLFVVTVVFICLWTPFIIFRLLLLFHVGINDYIYKFAEVLILSSTAVNGFIYALMSTPFRKAFSSILCCKNRIEV